MFRRFLSEKSKNLYDQLNDDAIWWRCNKYRIWIENRKVRPRPEGVDYLFDSVHRMMNEGLWEYNPPDTLCLWCGNSLWWLDYHTEYNPGAKHPKVSISLLDRIILWPIVKKRIRREQKDAKLKLVRALRGQDSKDGYH